MKKSYLGTFVALGIVLTVAGFAAAVVLDHPQERKYTQWIAMTGTIDSVDAEAHKIQIGGREFALDHDAQVIRGDSYGALSDLKTGDTVTVRYLRAGLVVTSIRL